MSDMTTIARPYAKAAFDFAVAHNSVDQWAEMLSFAGAVAADAQMQDALSGSMSPASLAELFISVCGEQVDEYGQNLIRVMAENGRLTALPEICAQFLALRQEQQKVIEAHVVSAIALDAAQQAAIQDKLSKRLDRQVQLNCSVDSTLIAGLIIRAGDLVIDNSVQGQIDKLSDALAS
ncbi:ATP synthase subunit delta [Vibrio stylophorae]|uniref:ATP synthase subunit delta n=1 Tax=Vibrio stylophorae TaxID=659351 RepID=A0ABN8DQW5_9VIBR|nr:F0F1 ATP synthase subunit delta [Vibrio stylophorae]CAH0532198.1 ATP synthase subunit delta [Vibrio stylophorae]